MKLKFSRNQLAFIKEVKEEVTAKRIIKQEI